MATGGPRAGRVHFRKLPELPELAELAETTLGPAGQSLPSTRAGGQDSMSLEQTPSNDLLSCYNIYYLVMLLSESSHTYFYIIGVRGGPERDISSLGVMGWGLAGPGNSSRRSTTGVALPGLGAWLLE